MATWSRLFVKLNNEDMKKLHANYVSVIIRYGHPNDIGNILLARYNNYDSVMRELIETRGIESIGALGVVCGEDSYDTHFRLNASNALGYLREFGCNNIIDYAYLFENGKWYVKEHTAYFGLFMSNAMQKCIDILKQSDWVELKHNNNQKSFEELKKYELEKIKEEKRIKEEEEINNAKYNVWCKENEDFLKRYIKENVKVNTAAKLRVCWIEESGLLF